MKEIGGYFELEKLIDKPQYPDFIPLNSGRGALRCLCRLKGIKSVRLPYYLCDVVWRALKEEGVAFSFYGEDAAFMPLEQPPLSPGEWLYVVNHFARLDPKEIAALKQRYQNIIVDNAQAFFEPPLPMVDTLYTCRKFFGVADGAYLATDVALPLPLPQTTAGRRVAHLVGRLEDGAHAHYDDFLAADQSFAGEPPRGMSRMSRMVLGAIDYPAIKTRRAQNYAALADALDQVNALPPLTPVAPFCYPFYHADGMALKKALAQQKIYVPTLWPNCLTGGDAQSRDYAQNILPLPCDQRYDRADMARIIKEIKKCTS